MSYLVDDTAARELFPEIDPLGFQEAVRLRLERIRIGEIETIWSDALASSLGDLPPVLFTQEQGMLIERRQLRVDARPQRSTVSSPASAASGAGRPSTGCGSCAGILDRMVGGVGMRRGRRHPRGAARGRCAGLLARGAGASGSLDPAARGDEGAGTGLACV